jgi:hypothetical protein
VNAVDIIEFHIRGIAEGNGKKENGNYESGFHQQIYSGTSNKTVSGQYHPLNIVAMPPSIII